MISMWLIRATIAFSISLGMEMFYKSGAHLPTSFQEMPRWGRLMNPGALQLARTDRSMSLTPGIIASRNSLKMAHRLNPGDSMGNRLLKSLNRPASFGVHAEL